MCHEREVFFFCAAQVNDVSASEYDDDSAMISTQISSANDHWSVEKKENIA